MFGLLTDTNHTASLQHNVEFFLALVGVKGVLLTGLEGVQAGEERVSLRQGGLRHLPGSEGGEAGDAFQKHDVQFTRSRQCVG